MVDINTAMAAASTERRNRGTGDKDRKKSRSGANLGIEPFDPVKHVEKEKADTASMWLVLGFAISVSFLMRYVVMGSAKDNTDLLWFLPIMCIFLLPSLHRIVLPDHFVELYTKGTWFKASFLHVFTWLAITFLLTNAPFGDIVAPQPDGKWGLTSLDADDGWDFSASKKGVITLEEGYSGENWVIISFTDNVEANLAEYTFTLDGEEIENKLIMFTGNDTVALDPVRHHTDIDYPVALAVPSDLSVGVHEFVIQVEEDGSPWHNSRTVTMKLEIVEPVVEEVVED